MYEKMRVRSSRWLWEHGDYGGRWWSSAKWFVREDAESVEARAKWWKWQGDKWKDSGDGSVQGTGALSRQSQGKSILNSYFYSILIVKNCKTNLKKLKNFIISDL